MLAKPRYQPGQKIGGRYQVHQALLGGMGEVYLCLDLKENRPFALKTFQARYLTNARVRDLFREEAATWVALEKHPHIVRCFYLNLIDNQPFLFLEWVAGDESRRTDLRSWLQRGPPNLRLALIFTTDICRGLIHAGQKQSGLVHRDLKPDNILVAQGAVAKITDFGLAKIAQMAELELGDQPVRAGGRQSIVCSGGVVGTPPYMAPEQWRNQLLDARTDIYAVGCILYELLTGRWPFKATTSAGFRRQHLTAPLPILPRDTTWPTGLERLLARCLAKQPAERFATVQDLFQVLVVVYQQQFAESPRTLPGGSAFTAVDYANRGATYDTLQRYDNALIDYTQAIQLDPTYTAAYLNRGNTFARLKRYPEALADLDKAIQLDSRSAIAHTNRGVIYEEQQNYDQALADHKRAIDLDPTHAAAYTNLGSVYEKLQRYEEALTCHAQAIHLDPTFVQAYINRGSAYERQQRYAEALADYTQAIQLDPMARQAYHDRATVYARLQCFTEALADYQQAIQLDPTDFLTYTNRASVYHLLQRYDDALADLTQALCLKPDYAPAYTNRGATYHVLQRYDKALRDYALAIELDPTAAKAYFNRGLLLSQHGSLTEALANFEKAAGLGLPQAKQQLVLLGQQLNPEST